MIYRLGETQYQKTNLHTCGHCATRLGTCMTSYTEHAHRSTSTVVDIEAMTARHDALGMIYPTASSRHLRVPVADHQVASIRTHCLEFCS